MNEHTTSVVGHDSLQGKHVANTARDCLCGKLFVPKNTNNTEELCPSCAGKSAVSILDVEHMNDDDDNTVLGEFNLRRELDCSDCC